MSAVSITGEEYVCYGENASGQFTPLIGVVKYDGTFSFREMAKDDLDRIPDDEVVPGCWMFRKTVSSHGAWVKRFALVRGGFIFLFHSPQNDKPLAVIPLDKCRIITPERQEKSFDAVHGAGADGFEFDIRHKSRPTVRCYALSELERQELVRACAARCDLPSNISDMLQLQSLLRAMPLSSTIRVSNTRLAGLNFAASEAASEALSVGHSPFASPKAARSHNPFLAPRPPLDDDEDDDADDGRRAPPPPPPPPATASGGGGGGGGVFSPSHSALLSGRQSVGSAAPLVQQRAPSVLSAASSASPPPPPPPQLTHQRLASLQAARASMASARSDSAAESAAEAPATPTPPAAAEEPAVRKLNVAAFAGLDAQLHRRAAEHAELREREDQHAAAQLQQQRQLHWQQQNAALTLAGAEALDVGALLSSAAGDATPPPPPPPSTAAADGEAAATPPGRVASLAEAFRLLLFFCDEELAEDPQPSAAQQFPHAKGAATEEVLLTVYRGYCDAASGFMSLEQLCDFLSDAALLQTHAPHDAADEPLDAFKDALDAVHLLRSLPRGAATSAAAAGRVDFGQWYQLLLRVASIVYADLYARDATVAFAQLLRETLTPLYFVCRVCPAPSGGAGGARRRTQLQHDPLLGDARILLALTTYAPNLWKVFLTYATDAVGKIADVALAFPAAAQLNERGLHRLPLVAPEKHRSAASSGVYRGLSPDSWLVSEAAWLRCCRDYALAPYVASNAALRDVYRAACGRKTVVSSRLPSREQLTTNSAARATRRHAQPPAAPGANKESMYFGRKPHRGAPPSISPTKFASISAITGHAPPSRTSSRSELPPLPSSPPPPAPPGDEATTPKGGARGVGLSFSEFVEALATVAVTGLQQPNYDVIFPGAFSKVLALLTVWGLADLHRLEEVRCVRTDEAY